MRPCAVCPDRPRLVPDGTWWRCPGCEQLFVLPQAGFQQAFCSSDASILLAASSAGPGKTMATLMAAARWVHMTGYRAWLVRQTKDDLTSSDGLVDQARALYEPIGGVWHAGEMTFRFETATGESSIQLDYIGRDYRNRYQGPAAAFLGIDELTQIDRAAFWWLVGSRLRSAAGVPVRVRATLNPDMDSWVYEELCAWWVRDDGLPDPDRLGRRRYLAGRGGSRFWGDTWQEAGAKADRGERDVLSVDFMTAGLSQNRYLANTGYEGRKGLLEMEDAAALEEGRWVRKKKGKLLRAENLAREIDAAPPGTRWVRVWDLAATAEEDATSANSFSAGVKLGICPRGRLIVGHAQIGRWGSADVEEIVLAIAGANNPRTHKPAQHDDVDHIDGRRVPVRFCREHAGAGKALGEHFVRLLMGWDVAAKVETGDKTTRLQPFVAQAQAGNVYLVRGPWNNSYRAHMLSLTIDSKGRLTGPTDAGDATARGLEELTGNADGAQLLEAAIEDQAAHGKQIAEAFDFSGASRMQGALRFGDEDDDGGRFGW